MKEGEELVDKHSDSLLSDVLDIVSQKVLGRLGPPVHSSNLLFIGTFHLFSSLTSLLYFLKSPVK